MIVDIGEKTVFAGSQGLQYLSWSSFMALLLPAYVAEIEQSDFKARVATNALVVPPLLLFGFSPSTTVIVNE